jgi:hypothetical protein
MACQESVNNLKDDLNTALQNIKELNTEDDGTLKVLEENCLRLCAGFLKASQETAAQKAVAQPFEIPEAQIIQLAEEVGKRITLQPTPAEEAALLHTSDLEVEVDSLRAQNAALTELLKVTLAALQSSRSQSGACIEQQKRIADKMFHLMYKVEDKYLPSQPKLQ